MAFFLPAISWGVTLTYSGPGGSPAPCDTTLQACIDGANSGDTIEIATNVRIDENLSIQKSLTIDAASGFTPLIGRTDPLLPRDIDISDPGSGTLSVALRQLMLSAARVNVLFSSGTDHNFEMSDCILSHAVDNNNDSGVNILLGVPSTILIQGNSLSSTGQPLQFGSNTTTGTSSITFLANQITTTDPVNSEQGIQIRPGGSGQVVVNVLDNVIFGIAGCNCGGPAGIEVDANNSVDAMVNIINNTLDDMQVLADGISVRNPSPTSQLEVNIFNNIVTRATQNAIVLPALSAALTVNNDFNDFFDSAEGNIFGGYIAGTNTLNVDPLYVDATSADYHLQDGSPLINAGTNTPTGGLPDVDADGNARIIDTTVDLGAFEFEPTPPPPPAGNGGGCSLIR